MVKSEKSVSLIPISPRSVFHATELIEKKVTGQVRCQALSGVSFGEQKGRSKTLTP